MELLQPAIALARQLLFHTRSNTDGRGPGTPPVARAAADDEGKGIGLVMSDKKSRKAGQVIPFTPPARPGREHTPDAPPRTGAEPGPKPAPCRSDDMLYIGVSPRSAAKLRFLLDKEAGPAHIRLRESRAGSVQEKNLRAVLKLSIDDEYEEGDLAVEAAGLPFRIQRDLADRFGRRLSVILDDEGLPSVAALS